MKELSRRDFLKFVGIGAAGLAVRPRLLPGLTRGLSSSDLASDVVRCFHEEATTGSVINEPVVQMMMDESVMALAGIRDVGEAWKTFFPGITASSVIGIKVNCINRYCPTHPEVVRSMVSGLAQMDFGGTLFPRNNIIVWDRTDSELTSSGYTIYTGNEPSQVRYVGTNHSGFGYDSGVTFNVNGSSQNPSRILSQMVDFLIDAAVLKNHSQGVVTLCLKNHYGSVHNPGGLQHSGGCSPAIPSLNQQIRDVITPNNIQKLFVIDGLFGVYTGGPGGSPNCNPKLLLLSRDPVACDYQGQAEINVERQAHGMGILNAAHITTAAQPPYSLGTTEVNLIDIRNVDLAEQSISGRGSGIQVSPLPVRERATVSFSLPHASAVSIDLADAAGRTQGEVFRGSLTRGRHRINWQPAGKVRAGTYFLRLSSRYGTQTKSITVLN
jgi:uncharacterized protein (DUF362 family)